MAKNGMILILLSALMVQVFSGYVLKADYAINRAEYLQNCINKEKPALQCKGKCQLSKKMQEADKEQQRAAEKAAYQLNLPGETICHQNSFLQVTFFDVHNNLILSYEQPAFVKAGYTSDIFLPPQLV